jgi:G:T-mismatch repair DNA endonuclease (very short patch repair protein)
MRIAALARYKNPAERLKTGLLLRGRTFSASHRNNISKAAEKRTGEKNAMYGQKHTQSSKNIIRARRVARVFPNKPTSIEIAMHKALKGTGVTDFEANKPLENICQPDIFISPNIVIFCDGNYWHRRPRTMRIDMRISKALIKRGYCVFRFWESDIKSDAQKCAKAILERRDNFEEWVSKGGEMRVYDTEP